MEITYIGHSGFLLEWDTCYWLFDYYKGEIPELNKTKKLFVFSSHKHADHFNPEIFNLKDNYQNIEFILASDIKIKEDEFAIYNKNEKASNLINIVKPSQQYKYYDTENNVIELKTLKSTDCGVAFLLKYQGKTIYHAGDLNLWVWKEETKQYNHNMTAMFQKEMNTLKNLSIDIAFAPLDPRQEDWYSLGLEELLKTAKVSHVFPMHFWNEPEIIQRFIDEKGQLYNNTKMIDIREGGQKWNMEI